MKEKLLAQGFLQVKNGSEGYYFVQNNQKLWAVFSAEGEQLNDFVYQEILAYEEGKAIARRNPQTLPEKMWFLELKEREVPQGTCKLFLSPTRNYQGDPTEKAWCILDEEGQVIGDAYFSEILPRREDGYILTKAINRDTGFLAPSGLFIEPDIKDECWPTNILLFQDGYARAYCNGLGVVNEKGKWVIPPKYDALATLSDGKYFYWIRETNESGYVDITGTEYTLKKHKNKNLYLYHDKKGNLAPVPEPGKIRTFVEDSCGFGEGLESVIVNSKGEPIIDVGYEKLAGAFWGDISYAKKDGFYGFIHRDGRELTDFVYSHIGFISKGYGQAANEDERILVGADGIIARSKKGYFGYNNRRKDPKTEKLRYSCGGDIWCMISETIEFALLDELDDSRITEDLEFSLLQQAPDGQCYFMTGKNTAVDLNGNILKNMEMQPVQLVQPKLNKETQKIVDELEKTYYGFTCPDLFKDLIAHEQWLGEREFSYGLSVFYQSKQDIEEWYDNWFRLGEEATLKIKKSLLYLGYADGTGGCYFFFVDKGITDLSEAPIVFIGSEGEINMVASTLKDFLQLVSINAEILGGFDRDTLACFYVDEDDEPSVNYYKPFIEWLAFNEIPILSLENYEERSNEIIQNAHDKYFTSLKEMLSSVGVDV